MSLAEQTDPIGTLERKTEWILQQQNRLIDRVEALEETNRRLMTALGRNDQSTESNEGCLTTGPIAGIW